MNADDVFYYLHDSRRVYIAITFALSENLQYMFPIATSTRNEILLWYLSIQHLFGTTYDDILEEPDRLRRWRIEPSKNLKYDLHILSQLIERVNVQCYAPFPYYKTEDPDPRNCSTERVRSTTLLRPLFLRFFSFTQRS